MTMASSPAGDIDSKILALQGQVDALAIALSAGKQTRLLMFLAFLAFALISGWGFFSLASRIQSEAYKQQLLATLQQEIERNHDELAKETELLVESLSPVVTTAITEQSKKDAPLFMQAFDAEKSKLINELPEKLMAKVDARHHDLVRQHEKLIFEELPAAQDPKVRDRMMANVCTALDTLVKKYYADEFKRHFTGMSETWNSFPVADAPSKDDAPLNEQLMGELMDLVAVKLARHRAGSSATE
jgi:hypothetical protein